MPDNLNDDNIYVEYYEMGYFFSKVDYHILFNIINSLPLLKNCLLVVM